MQQKNVQEDSSGIRISNCLKYKKLISVIFQLPQLSIIQSN